DDNLNGVVLAAVIGSNSGQKDLVSRLLLRTQTAANKTPNLLVRIAVLNECFVLAKRMHFEELSVALQADIERAIEYQTQGHSLSDRGEMDFAHEIRTRLLRKSTDASQD
ncbi:MAG: hypothetical protein ACK58L_23120, partial [Planctomycetota bacterium]